MRELHSLRMIGEMGLDAFCERYAIKARSASGLISLKYNQVGSPMHEPAVQECRGMIVREDDPTELVCLPYTKFFNLGEPLAHPIDWTTSRVLEKLDGSLMILYYDHRASTWRVASSGTPTADGPFNGFGMTFAAAFWETWNRLGYRLPEKPRTEEDDIWYFFELCRPDNRIVVRYEQPRIVLHGARARYGLWELSLGHLENICQAYGWELVRTWDPDSGIPSKSWVSSIAKNVDPMALEGFVVVDADFNRVKVKSPRYVEIHHLRGEGVYSPRGIVQLLKEGEAEEVLAHFPEMRAQFDPITQAIDDGVRGVYEALRTYGHLDRKTFASHVHSIPFSSVAFRLFGDPTVTLEDVRREAMDLNTMAILRALGLRE